MRGRLAAIAGASTILLILVALFLCAPPPSWRNADAAQSSVAGHYPYVPSDPVPWAPPKPKGLTGEDRVERLIVKVKLAHEDDAWLDALFPVWRKEVITIDPAFSSLHPHSKRVDKGRVASAYLAWIIENYDFLPSTTVFLPPAAPAKKQPAHEALFWKWKLAAPSADMQKDLEGLQTAFIQSSGFAALRCPSARTCANLVLPFRDPPKELRTTAVDMPHVWADLFGKKVPLPEKLGTVPGAEFAVSKKQILKRGLDEYVRFWSWLNSTDMDDNSAGLVFEYLWHVVFGREALWCPDEDVCRCEVYARCGGEKRGQQVKLKEKGKTSWWG